MKCAPQISTVSVTRDPCRCTWRRDCGVHVLSCVRVQVHSSHATFLGANRVHGLLCNMVVNLQCISKTTGPTPGRICRLLQGQPDVRRLSKSFACVCLSSPRYATPKARRCQFANSSSKQFFSPKDFFNVFCFSCKQDSQQMLPLKFPFFRLSNNQRACDDNEGMRWSCLVLCYGLRPQGYSCLVLLTRLTVFSLTSFMCLALYCAFVSDLYSATSFYPAH